MTRPHLIVGMAKDTIRGDSSLQIGATALERGAKLFSLPQKPDELSWDQWNKLLESTWDEFSNVLEDHPDGRNALRALQQDLDEVAGHVERTIKSSEAAIDSLVTSSLFADPEQVKRLAQQEAEERQDRMKRILELRYASSDSMKHLGSNALCAVISDKCALDEKPLSSVDDRHRLWLAVKALIKDPPEKGIGAHNAKQLLQALVRRRARKRTLQYIHFRGHLLRYVRLHSAVFGVAPWSELSGEVQQNVRGDPADPVELQLEAIRSLIDTLQDTPELISELYSNKAIFEKAAEVYGLKYKDPDSTFRKSLDKHFPDRFGRKKPKSLEEWITFFGPELGVDEEEGSEENGKRNGTG